MQVQVQIQMCGALGPNSPTMIWVHTSYLKTTFSDGTYVPDRQKPEFNTKCDQTIITPAAMLHSVLGSFHMKVASGLVVLKR